jgi:hypothetical protein
MEPWFTSNLILAAVIAPTVSWLAINSVYEIASWNRGLYKLAKPSLISYTQLANDFTYDVKMKVKMAEEARLAEAHFAEADFREIP